MLAAEFLSQNSIQTAWYELDSLDTDPVAFFSFFPQAFSSLSSISPAAFSLPELFPEDMLGLPNFSRSFFRQLFSQLPGRWVLVLDNCQVLPEDSPVLRLLVICLEELPVNCRAILLSRTSSPPAFARMKISGLLQVLDPETLSFTRNEIGEVMSLYGLDPQQERSLDYLDKMTSGWAAGLTLLLRECDKIPDFQDQFDILKQQELFDYFTEEIFSRFEEEEKKLLMLASLLPEINTAILDQLHAGLLTRQCFIELSRSNFFTYALDSRDTLFQFHPLFKDFLRKKADTSLSAATLISFQEQAANILTDEGRIEDAVDLLTRAGSLQKSMILIKRVGSRLLEQGRFKTLLRWQQILPLHLVEKDPWLLLFFGNAIIAFDPPRGIDALKKCFALSQEQGNDQTTLLACSSLTNAIINYFSDLSALDPLLDFLEQQLNPETFSETDNFENVSIANSIFRAMVLRRPTHPDLDAWLQLVIKQGGMRPALVTYPTFNRNVVLLSIFHAF
ncbi:MAG: hypothetical protein L3J57_10195 [Desulfuromusa sp.]|nr:hypothetical protein [Desulfuromusa sp.]